MAGQCQNPLHRAKGELAPFENTDQLLPAFGFPEFRVGGLNERPIEGGSEVDVIQSRFATSGMASLTRKSPWDSKAVARKGLDQGGTIRPTISRRQGGAFPWWTSTSRLPTGAMSDPPVEANLQVLLWRPFVLPPENLLLGFNLKNRAKTRG